LITLIDHEKEEERLAGSGIQRIWGETKYSDIVECNLSIPGNFKKSHTTLQPYVVNSIISVLQGIPSDLFILDVKTLEFSLSPGINLKPLKMTRELILSYFEEYMEAGSYFLHLSEIAAFLTSNPQN
jgi:hypothetical protein